MSLALHLTTRCELGEAELEELKQSAAGVYGFRTGDGGGHLQGSGRPRPRRGSRPAAAPAARSGGKGEKQAQARS